MLSLLKAILSFLLKLNVVMTYVKMILQIMSRRCYPTFWSTRIIQSFFFFFFFNFGVSQAHGEAQTNPQGEVQPTDRPSLRVLNHGA